MNVLSRVGGVRYLSGTASVMKSAHDKIILSQMAFFGRHGCNDAEVQLGQRFLVDLEIEADLDPAGKSDSVDDTISYDEVFNDVQELVEGPHRKLVETVAKDITLTIFEKYPIAKGVRVRIMKPNAPVPGQFLGLGVELYRTRH